MSAIVANLKEYLNACLRLKNYREYKPVDQLSSVVASWLCKRRQYKDYYIYLVWFAMREVLLKKFKYDVDVSDVTKTFMEYPDMFAKMLNEEYVPTDKMWLCRLCKDHFVHIYKIMAVTNVLQSNYVRNYGKPDFLALLPDDISANLDNDDIHHLKVMPKNEVMSNIITFLQTSLNNKKWCSVPYNDQYMINLYDLVMFECENLEYSDVNVHKIWYSVKIITKHEHDILTIGFIKSGSIQKFSEENPKLFELIGNDHCFQSNEDIGMKLFNMFKQFVELNDDDKITINLPDIIVRNVLTDEDKLNLCKEFFKEYQRLPKHNEVYKDFNIGSFIRNNKENCNSLINQQVAKIFEQEIRAVKVVKLSDEDKIKLCKEFYDEFKRLPNNKEVYKNFKIGKFIQHIKESCNSQLKQQVEEIFHQEIRAVKVVTTANTENKQIDYEQKKREYDDAIEEVLELTKKLMDFIYELKSPKYESKFSYNEVVEIMSKAYDLSSALK